MSDGARHELLCLRNSRAAALGAAVVVQENLQMGQSLIATDRIDAGAIIFRERPLFAVQYQPPWEDGATDTALACAHCLAAAGSLGFQLAHLAQLGEDAAIPDIALWHDSLGGKVSPPVRCGRGCDAYFCSEKCATCAEKSYHWGLCPSTSAASASYVQHAKERGGEYYLLAARIIATALAEESDHERRDNEKGQGAKSAALRIIEGLSGDALVFEDTVTSDEAAAAGFGSAATDNICVHTAVMAELLTHALAERLLQQPKEPELASASHRTARAWLTPKRFGVLLGRLRLNCQTVRVPSRLLDYFELLGSGAVSEGVASAALLALAEPIARLQSAPHVLRARERLVEEEEWMEQQEGERARLDGDDVDAVEAADMFPATQGIALFPLQSAMNHSCAANALVTTTDATESAEVVVVAGEAAIEPGQEITFDYRIGDRGPPDEKRRALERQYHFTCACRVCQGSTTSAGSQSAETALTQCNSYC